MRIINLIIDRVHRYGFICYTYSMRMCQGIRKKVSNKMLFKIILFAISPIILLRFLFIILFEYTFGYFLSFFRKQRDKKREFDNELAIVAIAKNEADYVIEWIEFHKIVGVSKFYIYDNESTDDLKHILKKYIENGEVVYTYFPGKSMQLPAYNDAINKYKYDCKYMAFIDLDEFLAPAINYKKLPNIIDSILNMSVHFEGIGVTWRIFGSSGFKNRPDGLVIENFLNRGVDKCWQNYHIKTVCNPRAVKEYTSPHFPTYLLGAWNVNEIGRCLHAWFPLGQCYDKIKINHYFCKSEEEAKKKFNRGLADREQKYDWKKFNDYDLNEVYDDGMLAYISEMKSRIV